jgi:hypothetical protein
MRPAGHGGTSEQALCQLHLSFSGLSKSHAARLAAVGPAIPQRGKADFAIGLRLTLPFAAPPGEKLEIAFQGPWERYKRLKQITDSSAREEAHSRSVEFRLVVDFGRDMPRNDIQLKTIQDVLAQMNMGPVMVVAEPVYEIT